MMGNSKVQLLGALAGLGGILAHGVFDLLHYGHIRHLQQAKALLPWTPLTVTITADRFIRKGPGRPIFPAEIRAECLAALACVDHVAIVEEATGLSAIATIQPRVYVKGIEYEGRGGIAELERMEVEALGGCVSYTPCWEHTTNILERLHA
jgi:cytidyltransferase-like protein